MCIFDSKYNSNNARHRFENRSFFTFKALKGQYIHRQLFNAVLSSSAWVYILVCTYLCKSPLSYNGGWRSLDLLSPSLYMWAVNWGSPYESKTYVRHFSVNESQKLKDRIPILTLSWFQKNIHLFNHCDSIPGNKYDSIIGNITVTKMNTSHPWNITKLNYYIYFFDNFDRLLNI